MIASTHKPEVFVPKKKTAEQTAKEVQSKDAKSVVPPAHSGAVHSVETQKPPSAHVESKPVVSHQAEEKKREVVHREEAKSGHSDRKEVQVVRAESHPEHAGHLGEQAEHHEIKAEHHEVHEEHHEAHEKHHEEHHEVNAVHAEHHESHKEHHESHEEHHEVHTEHHEVHAEHHEHHETHEYHEHHEAHEHHEVHHEAQGADEIDQKRHEEIEHKHSHNDSGYGDQSHRDNTLNISGGISLPSNPEEAADNYVENLIEKVEGNIVQP